MSELENYLTAVESRTGLARDEVLAAVLHIDTMAADHLRRIAPSMSADTARLAARLDFEVKVANPGVHYVRRGTYLGYRREQAAGGRAGARSQVFLSVVPKKRYLNVVFVAPDAHPGTEFVEHLGELGHHGVGTARCEIHNDADLTRFLEEYAEVVAFPAPRT